MRFLTAIGDAMLGRLAPRAVAGACCNEYGRIWERSCGPNGIGREVCYRNCHCQWECDPCVLPAAR